MSNNNDSTKFTNTGDQRIIKHAEHIAPPNSTHECYLHFKQNGTARVYLTLYYALQQGDKWLLARVGKQQPKGAVINDNKLELFSNLLDMPGIDRGAYQYIVTQIQGLASSKSVDIDTGGIDTWSFDDTLKEVIEFAKNAALDGTYKGNVLLDGPNGKKYACFDRKSKVLATVLENLDCGWDINDFLEEAHNRDKLYTSSGKCWKQPNTNKWLYAFKKE